MLFFIYGTLKSTGSHRHLLEGQSLKSKALTEPGYMLLSCGNYPAMVRKDPGASIEGELWEIDSDRIPELDAYEGSDYQKTKIRLVFPEGGLEVMTYLYLGDSEQLPDCGTCW